MTDTDTITNPSSIKVASGSNNPGGWIAECNRRLSANGMSMTRQRSKLLEVLALSDGHVTADRVLTAVQEEYPQVNKTTVYRTLELLAQLGLVAVSHTGSTQATYEVLENPHHHLVCKVCGEEVELADSTLDSLRLVIQNEHGFRPCFDHFVVFGICPGCQQADEPR